MQVFKINDDGHYLTPVVLKQNEKIPHNCITERPTDGLYRAKWTGAEWVEDMTQEEIDELNNPTKEQEIITAKGQLEETDYKIIKSSEYQLLGLETPYNLEELHVKRQELRNRINELEGLS